MFNCTIQIESILYSLKLDFIKEYKFHPARRFRADYYIPRLNLIIEFEGGVWNNGRHTRALGYSKDCIKYNEAVKLGYKVLRYTNKTIVYLYNDLMFLLKKDKRRKTAKTSL